MKTLKDLTPKIQAKIPEYQKKILEPIYNGSKYKNFDLEKAKKAIKWNYEKCGFKMPTVLVAENPLEQQYLFNYLKLNQKKYEKILYVLNNEFVEITINDVKCKISSYFILFYNFNNLKIDSQLHSQLNSQLHSQLHSQLNSQLDSQLYLKEISIYNKDYLFTLNIYSEVYYTWFEFIRKEFNLNLTINNDFQECFRLHSESGIYSAIFSQDICVISKYPLEIYQNNRNNYVLNNRKDQAIVWSNSFAPLDCYYINGVNVSKELFFKLKSKEYTFEEWSKEENEEIKALVLFYFEEEFGGEYVYRFLSEYLKEVDTYTHKKEDIYLEGTTKSSNIGVYTLFKGNVTNTDVAYVRCYCPSTDRIFFLGVHESMTNAKDAIASLCQIPLELKDNLKSITRCGENFAV